MLERRGRVTGFKEGENLGRGNVVPGTGKGTTKDSGYSGVNIGRKIMGLFRRMRKVN